jgi:hypothetical protein
LWYLNSKEFLTLNGKLRESSQRIIRLRKHSRVPKPAYSPDGNLSLQRPHPVGVKKQRTSLAKIWTVALLVVVPVTARI